MFSEKEIQNKIINGDTLDILKQFPDECIDLVITSPPYFGLRSYLDKEHPDKKKEIGLEDTFEQYIDNLMEIFMEIKRVLKKSGSFYLNIGDTYGGSQGKNAGYPDSKTKAELPYLKKPQRLAKCLMGIPERFMLKMIDEGWILRNKIIWRKSNHMPGSQKDRLTCSWEPIYHFVKNNKGSDWYVYGNEPLQEKFPEKHKIWLNVPEKFRSGCWYKDNIPKDILQGFLNLDYYYDLDIIREPHKFISLKRYNRALDYGATFAPDSKAAESKEIGGNVPKQAPKSFQAFSEGQKMSVPLKEDGICAVPKNIRKNWKERNEEIGYPEDPPMGISKGGGQTGLKKKFEEMDSEEIDLFGSPRAREERLKRGGKGGEFNNLFIEAKINPNDICSFCGRTYRRHVGIQSGKTRLMLCSKRNKTEDESSFKAGGMRQAPEPGEKGAFNIKGKNPSDFILTEEKDVIDNKNSISTKDRGDAKEKLKERGIGATGIGPTGFDHNLLSNSKGKNPSDFILTEREENIREHFKERGGGGGNPGHGIEGSTLGMEEGNHRLGKNPSDFFDVTTVGFAGSHFATFPSALLFRPILSSCPKNGIILDPFSGSGTTSLVAKVLKRNYVGIDISEKYVKMAKNRILNLIEQEKVMIKLKEKYPKIYEKFIGQKSLF